MGAWPNFRRLPAQLSTQAHCKCDTSSLFVRRLLRGCCLSPEPASKTVIEHLKKTGSYRGISTIPSARRPRKPPTLPGGLLCRRFPHLLPQLVFAHPLRPFWPSRRTRRRFGCRPETPLGAPRQIFAIGARGVPPLASHMAMKFHRPDHENFNSQPRKRHRTGRHGPRTNLKSNLGFWLCSPWQASRRTLNFSSSQ